MWQLNFLVDGLSMGSDYRICVDADGSPGFEANLSSGLEYPVGESGLFLFVAPLGTSVPPAVTIRAAASQEVVARCVTPPCRELLLPGSTATAFLAAPEVRCALAGALSETLLLRAKGRR